MAAVKSGFTWKKAYLILGILFVCLAVRAFLGVDSTDESFYFAVARRFSQGDAMLVDEWFPSQMIGILLLPFYNLYVMLNGSREGIILCARLCYTVFAVLTAAYMMRVFRRNEETVMFSFLSSVIFAVYARAGIATFSYYNVGLLTLLLAMLFLMDGRRTRVPKIKWFMAGISFSVSVLCMPYMVFFFVCMSAYYLCCRRTLSIGRDGISFIAGICAAAGVFLAFFGCDVLEGISNLPYLLMNPQHQGSIPDKTISTFLYILFTYLKYTWPLYIVTFAAAVFMRLRTVQDQRIVRTFRILVYLEYLVQAVYSRTFFEGGIVCAFLLLALQIQIINPGIRERELERYFLLPGIVLGLVWINGSNLGMRVFNMGFCLADVWALKILERDIRSGEQIFRWLKNVSVAVLFLILLANRFFDVYRDSVIWKLDTQVSCGSMKGIFTTAERAEEYENVIRELNEYTVSADRLAVPGLNPWIYLEAPARCGSLSVWNVGFEHEMNWIYYEKYPENIPTVIYLLSPDRASYEGWRWGSHGNSTQGVGTEQAEGYLKELLDNRASETLKTDTGVFYRFTAD